jgi:glycosyltransferase involved in cell wall biosynthesis
MPNDNLMPQRLSEVTGAAPLVSVVMAVFNGERFLREAMESILAQAFRDFEFIIVNDGSTDGTAAILESYARSDSRVHVYQNEKNRGNAESWNRGCRSPRPPGAAD